MDISALRQILKHRVLTLVGLDIKAEYVRTAPSAQNAVDIFAGEWASLLPDELNVRSGTAPLFADERIAWLEDAVGGLAGLSVLELGPLEGGHTYMMQRMGAAEIVAVEGNTRAYIRCLIVKELLDLHAARFLCGDIVEHLRLTTRKHDLCVASGVLYHMRNPVEMIELAAQASDRLYLWTHYHHPETIAKHRLLALRFRESQKAEHAGFAHTLHRQVYASKRGNAGFFGGAGDDSCWLSRDDLLNALRHFGFDRIQVHFDNVDSPSGSNISLLASRGDEAHKVSPPGGTGSS